VLQRCHRILAHRFRLRSRSGCPGAAGSDRRPSDTVTRLDGEEFARWREQAGRTLETAELAVEGKRHEWACFLAEQAAQFAVKGLLHAVGEPAWGHDLIALERQVATALDEVWSGLPDEAARLSRHYIAARYPDAHPAGSPGSRYRRSDADMARQDAEAVIAAIDQACATLEADGTDEDELT
jgi:HEPN domain-containing protein